MVNKETKVNLKELITHMECLKVVIHHYKQEGFNAEDIENELNFCQKFIDKKISEEIFINKIKTLIKLKL